MRMFDTRPLLRSAVGFDNLNRLFDSVTRLDTDAGGYPPYDIEKVSDDDYRITMAVAGFTADELDITVKDGALEVSSVPVIQTKAPDNETPETSVYLHRGIARRTFKRRFQLADTIQVTNAALENGLLHIDLHREIPEELKPRQIEIQSGAGSTKLVDQKAA